MSVGRAVNYFLSFVMFVIVVVILGALFPEYFGFASELITENLGTLALLLTILIIIYLLSGKER